MRLILVDRPGRRRLHFYPLALCRPIWELRCGMTTLAEKLLEKLKPAEVACFVPDYMAEVYRAASRRVVNDPASLAGDDLLLLSGRVRADGLDPEPGGPSRIVLGDDGELLWAWIARADLARLETGSIDALLESAGRLLPAGEERVPTWDYTWDLVLANPGQLAADFAAAARSGIEGRIEEPQTVRGSLTDIYVAPGAVVHPMVVLDATGGPICIDQGAEIHPFTRIEGPCYIGRESILLGAKCRAGNTIGPVCRIGGEVEGSIIQGYSNEYHDGFLGHAYVGEWVNLGALTTNSDLRNDYGEVSVTLDGRHPIGTGSAKVGSLIGDHAKTSIGTLLNTGAYVGAMSVIVTAGKLLPKFVPSFAWYFDGVIGKGFGKQRLYQTAKTAMGRRGRQWTTAEEAMWDSVFEITQPAREEAIRKGRRALSASDRK
jgi:UDP-N-acetylglucosamine diphosphorylase/glucosamine-1-phosphate N-acetyltransferase